MSGASIPTLRPADIVVMDNLPPHKAAGVREAIGHVGGALMYLPPDSPQDTSRIKTDAL